MDDTYEKSLLRAAMMCDNLTGQKEVMTNLACSIIDGSSSTAMMSLLWKISDISRTEDLQLRAAIRELNDSLMHFHKEK